MMPIEYLGKIMRELPAISRQTGYPTGFLARQFFLCYIACRAEIDEFRTLRLYDCTRCRRRQYLTYKDSKRISDMLNRGADDKEISSLTDKRLINELFAPFIRRRWLYMPGSTLEQVEAFVRENDTFLVKACIGTQGKSIKKLSAAGLDLQRFYREYHERECILEELICQHPTLAAVNPGSVNTIRVVTARIGQDVSPIGAGLRCGGSGQFVDNFHHGGVAYPIDLESGIITGPGVDLDGSPVLRHPTTGHIMPGLCIPFWSETLALLREAAIVPAHIGYVGWDIAVTPDGPVLVEANINYPGNNIIQIDRPGARKRLYDFLREHGL